MIKPDPADLTPDPAKVEAIKRDAWVSQDRTVCMMPDNHSPVNLGEAARQLLGPQATFSHLSKHYGKLPVYSLEPREP